MHRRTSHLMRRLLCVNALLCVEFCDGYIFICSIYINRGAKRWAVTFPPWASSIARHHNIISIEATESATCRVGKRWMKMKEKKKTAFYVRLNSMILNAQANTHTHTLEFAFWARQWQRPSIFHTVHATIFQYYSLSCVTAYEQAKHENWVYARTRESARERGNS